MEEPDNNRIKHLDQSAEFVQGAKIVLLKGPSPVTDFVPGVFSTLVTLSSVEQKQSCSVTIPFLDLHLERLCSNAREAGLRGANCLDPAELRASVNEKISAHAAAAGRPLICRLIASDNPELYRGAILISVDLYTPKHPPAKPLALKSVLLDRPLPHIKSTDLSLQKAAAASAAAAGADEALLVDSSGYVRECAWANLFWVDRRGRVLTPARSVLPGITRRVLLENGLAELAGSEIDPEMLAAESTEVFISQSTAGITPVSLLDGKTIPVGLRTAEISRSLNLLRVASTGG